MFRRSPTPSTKRATRWGALTGSGLRQHRSGYLPDRAQSLLERPESGAMTVDALQDIVTRLSDEWGIDCPPITVDNTVTGQIGRVTQLRGRTTMAFEPAVLDLPVADAEVAVGHELAHLVHPAVPGSSLDGWRRGFLVLAAIGLLSLPLTLALAPLLAVSVATEVVTTLFVVHWALVARLQRQYEFFADRYSAKRLGGTGSPTTSPAGSKPASRRHEADGFRCDSTRSSPPTRPSPSGPLRYEGYRQRTFCDTAVWVIGAPMAELPRPRAP